MAATRDGLALLQWVTERILKRQVPALIRPLLFDVKLIGLQKQSKMAEDIEMLASQALLPAGARGEGGDSVPGAGGLQHCEFLGALAAMHRCSYGEGGCGGALAFGVAGRARV